MDIFNRALRLEKTGARLYRTMAKKAPDKGLVAILKWLAGQEDKHYSIIKRLKAGTHIATTRKVNFKGIKRIFRRMKAVAEDLDFKASQLAIYRKALKVEEKSVNFYVIHARAANDPEDRKVLTMLAGEERRHVVVVENMIDFVTEPERWIENAEFAHLRED